MPKSHKTKIIFSGGGTLGPVTPLLAVHEVIAEAYPDADFLWVGTKKGPEKTLVEQAGMPFVTLSSGKFRRYLSIWNVIDIGRIIVGFFQSLRLIWKEKPSMCISAGGFISVPLHWAAWLFGVPTWIHQQDLQVGLANRIMAPAAKQITTAIEAQVRYFSRRKTKWLGNPVRREIMEGDKKKAIAQFTLEKDIPVIFATGGGTGSLRVNQLIVESIPHLEVVAQVIHLSGKDRPKELVERATKTFPDRYQSYQFFTHEMKQAYAAADIVISRGGFGTLTEIAALGKIAIIIPKPGHQVQNVKFLEKQGAVIYVNERTSDGNYLAKVVKQLLENTTKQKQLQRALQRLLPRAEDKVILDICKTFLS